MKTDRRTFLKSVTSAGVLAAAPGFIYPKSQQSVEKYSPDSPMIWANLVHLSTNMWEDNPYVGGFGGVSDDVYRDDFECKTCKDAYAWAMRAYRPYLLFDEKIWNRLLTHMADSGMNMVIIDLGDGVKYESHPEIAVKNAWSVDKLRSELAKMRKLGLEPIPKLNFATGHDTWLGEYSRMVSTSKYYEVCRNLISEVIEIFDTPRYFHLGMDEETAGHQKRYEHIVVRQNDLWWNDFYFFVNEVEKKGVRSWIWSDYGWRYPDLFFKKMPKSVLQSNWYYREEFNLEKLEAPVKVYLEMYNRLQDYGYDQVPTGSNYSNDTNMEGTVEYGKNYIASDKLLGFMTAPWFPVLDICFDTQLAAIDQVARAKKRFYK